MRNKIFLGLLLLMSSIITAQTNLLSGYNNGFEDGTINNFAFTAYGGVSANTSLSNDSFLGTQSLLISVTNPVAVQNAFVKAGAVATSGKTEFTARVHAKTDANGVNSGAAIRFRIIATLADNTTKNYASEELLLTDAYQQYTYTKTGVTDDVVSLEYSIQYGGVTANYYLDNAILLDEPLEKDNLLIDANYNFEEPSLSSWSVLTQSSAEANASVSNDAYLDNSAALINVTVSGEINNINLVSGTQLVSSDYSGITCRVNAKTDLQGVTNGTSFRFNVKVTYDDDTDGYFSSSTYVLTDEYEDYSYERTSFTKNIVSAVYRIQMGAVTGNYYFDNTILEDGSEKVIFTEIAPNNSNIHYTGSNFKELNTDGEYKVHRHFDDAYDVNTNDGLFNYKKSLSNAGIIMQFKTNSPTVKVKFRMSAAGNDKNPTFDVYKDDVFSETYTGTYFEEGVYTLKLFSDEEQDLKYKILLPGFTDVHIIGVEVLEGYSLTNFTLPNLPRYLAYGDSITHGVGQTSQKETYAYLLADALGYEPYNIAVGGAKVSQQMAEMVRDEFPNGYFDLMTVLIGYNDMNGAGFSPTDYKTNVNNFLDAVRSTHTTMPIFLIKLLYTTTTESGSGSGFTPDDFRTALQEVYDSRKGTDSNLYIVDGESITKEADLNDKVHLNTSGAASFANELKTIIDNTLNEETLSTIIINKNTDYQILNKKIVMSNDLQLIGIYNVMGQEVVNQNLSGVYILKIENKRGLVNFKKVYTK